MYYKEIVYVITVYTLCQPILVFVEEPTWLKNWRTWKKRYEHFTLVFCRWFENIRLKRLIWCSKLQLHLISQFTRDISMQFGCDKCAYLNIERGNQKSLGQFLTLDETKLAELTEGECYKCLEGKMRTMAIIMY